MTKADKNINRQMRELGICPRCGTELQPVYGWVAEHRSEITGFKPCNCRYEELDDTEGGDY